MRISKVHAQMRDEIRNQGPLVNAQTGLRSRHNRGVRRAWKLLKRRHAEQRQVESELLRPQNARKVRLANQVNDQLNWQSATDLYHHPNTRSS